MVVQPDKNSLRNSSNNKNSIGNSPNANLPNVPIMTKKSSGVRVPTNYRKSFSQTQNNPSQNLKPNLVANTNQVGRIQTVNSQQGSKNLPSSSRGRPDSISNNANYASLNNYAQ